MLSDMEFERYVSILAEYNLACLEWAYRILTFLAPSRLVWPWVYFLLVAVRNNDIDLIIKYNI